MARPRFSKFFGEVVQKHRNEQDISQEVLAEIAEIHRTHIGFIERGEQSPSLDVAHRVAAALGLRLATRDRLSGKGRSAQVGSARTRATMWSA